MSDLTNRLRKQAKEIANENIPGWGNTMSDAADHIEPLNKQIAELKDTAKDLSHVAAMYLAENKRLKSRNTELEPLVGDTADWKAACKNESKNASELQRQLAELNDYNKYLIENYQAEIAELQAQPQWVSVEEVRLLLSFCPEGLDSPKGLDPTFYITGDAYMDQDLLNKLNSIRRKIPSPPSDKA